VAEMVATLRLLCLVLLALMVPECLGRSHKIKVGHGQEWGLALQQEAADVKHFNKEQDNQVQTGVQDFFKEPESPAIRQLMKDPLFLRQLEMFLDQPNQKHFRDLRNRVKTLRRRRPDDASTRFFLRD